jgi:hypothetical protein
MRLTRQQREALKKKGDMLGYFGAPALGRPKKQKMVVSRSLHLQ